MPTLVKDREFDVYSNPERWAGNPNVLLLQSGEILVGFRTAGFPIRRDTDPTLRPLCLKAATIEEIPAAAPVMILDEPNSLTPAFFQRRDGLILTFFNRYATHPPESRAEVEGSGRNVFAEEEGCIVTREPITIMASRDGINWDRFSEIDVQGLAFPPAFRGNMVYANDGAILFSVYTSDEPVPNRHMKALLVRSPDGGKTWECLSTIADDPERNVGFNETSLYRTESGRLVAFLRTSGESRNIHTAVSADDGKTWAPYQRHETYGFPQDALRLDNGSVLLTYGLRNDAPGVCGKLLDAECANIDGAEEFRINNSATGACGYPASIQLADGTILTVYYTTPARGRPAKIGAAVLRE